MTREWCLTRLLPLLFLAAVTFVVYSSIFGHQFIPNWDDYYYVLENDAVRGFSLGHLREAFTNYFVGNYAPVQIVSYMVDYTLWGLNPGGYLAGNVLLHTVNGLLVFLLLLRLGFPTMPAFLAAAVFLWHPVQVESVAWVSQRKNVLAMLFFLIAFFHYIAWRETGRWRLIHYLLSVVALFLALLSKSVVVIFPVAALLYDLCLARSKRRIFIADKVPYLVAAAAVAALAVVSQAQDLGGGRREYPGGNLLTALYSMLPVPGAYLRDCFFPTELSPFYLLPIRTSVDAGVVSGAVTVTVLVLAGIFLYRRQPRAAFFYLFFFLALVPVSQVVPLIPLKTDRYLYFPLLGFAGCLAEALRVARERFRSLTPLVIGVVFIATLPVLSFRQAQFWENDVALWSHAVQLDPENRVGWLLLAKGYTLRGEGGKALEAMERYRVLREKLGPPRGWEHE